MPTVDATGVHVPPLIDAVNRKVLQWQSVLGSDLSLAAQTPQSQLAGISAVPDVEVAEALAAMFAGIDPRTAPGIWLDLQGGLLMIPRRPATRSHLTATLTGEAAAVVPAGSRAATAEGVEFRTIADAILSPSGVAVGMEAVVFGPVPAAAGALTRIVTVVAGWDTVTNPEAAVLGSAEESDAEYRQSLGMRAANTAVGPLAALEAGLADALAAPFRVLVNDGTDADTTAEMRLNAHALLVIAEGGLDGDVRRAVEYHKGMGVPTMTAIRGGTPDNTALGSVSAGAITWAGEDYTGLDLQAADTDAKKAAALTTLLDGRFGVSVWSIDGTYWAFFEWKPAAVPVFADGTVANAFGLSDAGGATYPVGPFLRARPRALEVEVTVTRATGFPADGLNQIREAVIGRVDAYGLGETLWPNDLLVAAETVLGTRVTVLTIEHDGTTLNAATEPPADARWSLALGDLTVTLT